MVQLRRLVPDSVRPRVPVYFLYRGSFWPTSLRMSLIFLLSWPYEIPLLSHRDSPKGWWGSRTPKPTSLPTSRIRNGVLTSSDTIRMWFLPRVAP